MRNLRRVGGTAIAGLLLSAAAAGPVTAQQTTTETKAPETYVGTAAAQALNLKVGNGSVLPSQVSAGIANVKIDSTLKAVADAAGLLGIPVVGDATAGKAEVQGSGTQDTTKKCGLPEFPAELAAVLSLGAGCSQSIASVVDGNPQAKAVGTVAELDVNLATVLSQVPLEQVQTTLLDPVLGGLDTINQTIRENDPSGQFPDLQLDDTVNDLITRLSSTKTLSLRFGEAVTESVTTGQVVTSTASAAGGTLQLLPLEVPAADGSVQLKPLIEVVIGSSKAQAAYDRAAGKSGTPSWDAAIVTIRVNIPTVDAVAGVLGFGPPVEIVVGPQIDAALNQIVSPIADNGGGVLVQKCADAANEYCLLPGTPLETRIAVASGRTVTNPDGTVGAVADAVKIHALKGLAMGTPLDGGILLELGHSEAGVGGRPAELVTVSLPDLPRELPRTGGTPWLPIAGVAGAAGLVLAALNRRVHARSN